MTTSVARAQGAGAPALLNIGQVLAKLKPDFPDLSPSKLRFLEEQRLISPARTDSGYRKFSPRDLERLRLIQKLTTELGLNLAGVELVLRLEDQLARAHARIERLEREKRDAVEQVHKSYRRDLVPLSQVTTLIPIRRNH